MRRIGDTVVAKNPLYIRDSSNEPGESWFCAVTPGSTGVVTETTLCGNYLFYMVRFGEHCIELSDKLSPLEMLGYQAE